MKYYVYISDAKIEMLLSQIPHEVKKKIATELKLDFKLLSITRKSETEADDDRYKRLEAVISFIREYGNLGSVEQPDEYFEDSLKMRWGPYGFGSDVPLIYFGGTTENTILGLGGSVKHVIGNTGSSYAHSHSATPYLLSYLEKELGLNQKRRDFPFEDFSSEEEEEGWALGAVRLATTQMKGPKQQLEFMAKRLMYGKVEGKQILLGTPIYVAMLD